MLWASSQPLKVSKTDIKNFIVVSTWIVELIIVFGVALGLIVPAPNSLQSTLVSAVITSFLTISGAALAAYFLDKGKTSTTP